MYKKEGFLFTDLQCHLPSSTKILLHLRWMPTLEKGLKDFELDGVAFDEKLYDCIYIISSLFLKDGRFALVMKRH